jgi:predicted ATPase
MTEPVFCGRVDDLDLLEKAWSDGTHDGYPQIVVLLGDSGMGKTRLAQELFKRLAGNFDSAHYWPRELGRNGRNLNINPLLPSCGPGVPSFLWWGLRFGDRAVRNAVAPSAVDADLPILTAHLERLARSVHNSERRTALQYLLSDFAADVGIELATHLAEIVPGVAAAKAAYKAARGVDRLRREHLADRPDLTLSEIAQRESREKTRRLAEIFTAVMETKDDNLPICILVDDGHFSEPDDDAVDLIKQLLGTARKRRWPFLLVVTFWPREWNEAKSPFAQWLHSQAANIRIRPLSRIGDLTPLLKTELPGLTPTQVKALTERVDGNPEFLEDITRWLQVQVGNFVGLDPKKALTPKGLSRVMTLAQDRHKFAMQRILDAGEPIRHALALGSVQGMRFLTDLLLEMAPQLKMAANLEAIQGAEKPHAFLTRDGILAEFVQRLYLEVATADLPNVVTDEEQVRALLIEALKHRIDNRALLGALTTKDRRATYALAAALLQEESDPIARSYAIRAAITLIDELMESHEFQAAGVIAAQVVDRWITAI